MKKFRIALVDPEQGEPLFCKEIDSEEVISRVAFLIGLHELIGGWHIRIEEDRE